MEEMINSLSKWQKVALWIAFVWLLFCLLCALGNSWYFVMLVCIALLAAILCLFRNKLDAKYAWTVFAVSLILPFIMVGASADSTDNIPTNQKEDKVEHPKGAVKSDNTEKSIKEQTKKVEKGNGSQLSPKEQEIAKAGEKQGIMFGMAGASNEGFSNMLDMADYVKEMDDKVSEMFEEMAGGEYDKQYGTPSNAEERKYKKIYIEHFIKAMNNTMDAMDN